jgi:hypothetical protein
MGQRRNAYHRLAIAGLVTLALMAGACGGGGEAAVKGAAAAGHQAGGAGKGAAATGAGGAGAVGGGYATSNP